MHEIVAALGGKLCEHRVLAAELHRVPSDMRNPLWSAAGRLIGKTLDAARQNPEASSHSVLVALIEEQLEPQAQAEIRAARFEALAQRVGEA